MKEVMKPFQFKQFLVEHDRSAMKVGVDGVLLGAWCHVPDEGLILDIGTGSGVIALIIAQRSESGSIVAVEIDSDSAEEASINFSKSPWTDRLTCVPATIQDFSSESKRAQYDLIVSNPPFFTGGTLSDNMSRNDVRHTQKLSHNDLLRAVKKLLKSGGRFDVILPFIEGLRFIEIAEEYDLYLLHKTEVKPTAESGVKRLLLSFSDKPGEKLETELIIQKKERNDWTEEYWDLVKDFYLDRP